MFYLLNFFRFLSEERMKGISFLLIHFSLVLFVLLQAPSSGELQAIKEIDFLVINENQKSIRLSPLVTSLGVEYSSLSSHKIGKYIKETLEELKIQKSSLLSSLYFSGGTLIFRGEGSREIEKIKKRLELNLKNFDVVWGNLINRPILKSVSKKSTYYIALIFLLICYFSLLPFMFKNFSSDSYLLEEFQKRNYVMPKSMGSFLMVSLVPIILLFVTGYVGNQYYFYFLLSLYITLFLFSLRKPKWQFEI